MYYLCLYVCLLREQKYVFAQDVVCTLTRIYTDTQIHINKNETQEANECRTQEVPERTARTALRAEKYVQVVICRFASPNSRCSRQLEFVVAALQFERNPRRVSGGYKCAAFRGESIYRLIHTYVLSLLSYFVRVVAAMVRAMPLANIRDKKK